MNATEVPSASLERFVGSGYPSASHEVTMKALENLVSRTLWSHHL
jgi:hypothetical protein